MNTVFIWIVATATINFSLCSSAATNWGLLLLFSSSTHSNSVLLSGAETSLDKDYMQWCLGVSLCSVLGIVLLYALLCVSFFSKREVSWRVSETLRVVYTFKTSCRSERFCYLLWYAYATVYLTFYIFYQGQRNMMANIRTPICWIFLLLLLSNNLLFWVLCYVTVR